MGNERDNEQVWLAHILRDLENKSYHGILDFLMFVNYADAETCKKHAEFYEMFFA